ncbi:MAG: hypothetical protein R2729_04275 [Bryobacteraceae bacterium]
MNWILDPRDSRMPFKRCIDAVEYGFQRQTQRALTSVEISSKRGQDD